MLFLSTDVIKKLHFFFSYTFVFSFFNFLFFISFRQKTLFYFRRRSVVHKIGSRGRDGYKGNNNNKGPGGGLLWEINVMRASDTCTGLRPGQYLTHAHRHITRHKEAMDSCFTLIRAHLHSTAVRPLYVQWPNNGETGVYDYQSSQVVWLFQGGKT